MIPTLSPATTITGSHSAAMEPFYGIAAFGLFSPLALIYSAVARLIFGGLGARSSNAVIVQQLPPTAPSLHPKRVAIVTGSNTGIGFETAKALVLEHGMEVILACRSRNKAMLAADSINKEMAPSCRSSDGGAIFTVPLDLTSWVSIQQFAASITARYEEIHVLVNNAGRNTSGPNGRLDLLFQSNFLGHFLLTQLLLGHLIKGKGRIVNLSSVMHHFCASSVPLSNPDYWNNCALYDRSPRETYVPSKLAAILFTLELQRRYGNQGITAVSVNPGAVNSDIWRGFPRWVIPLFRLIYLIPAQGCTTSVAAAVDPSIQGGDYLQPYWLPSWGRNRPPFPVFEMLGPYVGYQVATPRLPNEPQQVAEALWSVSEELTDCHFPAFPLDQPST